MTLKHCIGIAIGGCFCAAALAFGQGAQPVTPGTVTASVQSSGDKSLSIEAQNKVLKIEIRQTELADQITPLVDEFNALNTQVNAIEAEDLKKQGIDPTKLTVDDGRQKGPGGGSEKTFKITPIPEPPKPPEKK